MSYHPIKSQGLKSLWLHDLGRPAPAIPVLFLSDSPRCFQIKIQPQKFMTPPDAHSEKPLIPALFQIAARAEELQSLESLPAVRNALALDRASRAEIMLDAEKLDAVLKAVAAKKKKSAPRRPSSGRFDKGISTGDRPTA
jgi:hypothetical protein